MFRNVFVNLIVLVFCLSHVISCDSDDDEYNLSYGTIIKTDGENYYINTDSDYNLFPYRSFIDINELEDSTRAIIEYKIKENYKDDVFYDYSVEVVRCDKILTKDIILDTKSLDRDSLGNDWFKIEKYRINNGFLTLEYLSLGDLSTSHMVSMVLLEEQTSDGRYILEVFYNKFDDIGNNSRAGVISFKLNSVFNFQSEEEEDIPLLIKYKDQTKDSQIEISYTLEN